MKLRHVLFLAASLAAAPLLAQEHDHAAHQAAKSTQPSGMGNMQGGMMGGMMEKGMMGMHMMPVTVTALDSNSGLVEATSGSMALKLHFPPASLTNVKVGDKLSVHLAFRKL